MGGLLKKGANKILGRSTAVGLLNIVVDVCSGNIDQTQLLKVQAHLSGERKTVTEGLTEQDQFSLQYEGHYASRPFDPTKERLDTGKETVDWYLKKWDSQRLRLDQEGSDSLLWKQLKALVQILEIRTHRGERYIVSKSAAVSEIQDRAKRLLAIYPDSLRDWVKNPTVVSKAEKKGLSFEIPIERNMYFNGRADAFQSLLDLLGSRKRVSLRGMGGVGKSSLAVEYAYQLRDKGITARWFYERKVTEGYAQLGRELGLEVNGVSKEIVRNQVNHHLQNGSPILFIFDNVEDYSDVAEYVNALPTNIQLIVTTRTASLSDQLADIKIEPWSVEEAETYVRRVLSNKPMDEVKSLVATIGTVPFKLSKAVAFLSENPLLEIGDYLQDREEREAKGETLPEVEVILGRLLEQGDVGKRGWEILQYAAYLNPDFIPLPILISKWSNKIELQAGIKILERYSLVDMVVDDKNKGLRIHRLLQTEVKAYAAKHPTNSFLPEKLIDTLLIILCNLMPKVTSNPDDSWVAAELYAKSVEAVLEVKKPPNKESAALSSLLGEYHDKISCAFALSLEWQERALKKYENLYFENHPDIASSLNSVGLVHRRLGDDQKALSYCERSLEMRETLYLGNHPDVAESLNNVGRAYETLHDYQKALSYAERSLKMNEALYLGNHQSVAQSLHNIGVAYGSLGDAQKALSYNERSLKMREALYPGNHVIVAESLNNLGVTYQALGDTQRALSYAERGLKMSEVLYPGNHPIVATLLTNVGLFYVKLGDIQKGLLYQERGLKMREALYPGNHPSVAESLTSVGMVYENLGKKSEALTHYQRALEVRKALDKVNNTQGPRIGHLEENIRDLSDEPCCLIL